jgi:hypothetical protein
MVLLSAVLDASISWCLESNWRSNWKRLEGQLEMIEKQFGSNWKGTEERLESKGNTIGKQLKIFGNFWSSFWQIIAMRGNIW